MSERHGSVGRSSAGGDELMTSVRALREARLSRTELEQIREKLARGRAAPAGRVWKAASAVAAAGLVLVALVAWWLARPSRPVPVLDDEPVSHLRVHLVREDGTTASLDVRYRPEAGTSSRKERR
jgi:hypothetical protein